jgi:hypothetical protein
VATYLLDTTVFSLLVKEHPGVPAKFGRAGFRRNFVYGQDWRGKFYATKQVEVYAVKEGEDWLAITLVTRFF